jgi:hypothetical protein
VKRLDISERKKRDIADVLGLNIEAMCWDCLYCSLDGSSNEERIISNSQEKVVSALNWSSDSSINFGNGIRFVLGHPLLLNSLASTNGRYLKIPMDKVEEPVLSSSSEGVVRARGYRFSGKDELKKKDREFLQDNLERIALFSKVELVRIKAVQLLNSQEKLAAIAENDESTDVRKTAVKKINSQEKLASIARKDKCWIVREEAAKKIKDKAVLEEVALKDDNWSVKHVAMTKIKNQKVFIALAHDSDWVVKCDAIGRIKDRNVLREIAENDEDDYVKKTARRRLKKILL